MGSGIALPRQRHLGFGCRIPGVNKLQCSFKIRPGNLNLNASAHPREFQGFVESSFVADFRLDTGCDQA